MWIIGGVLSAILAYFANKIAVKKYGDKAIILFVPVIEEVSKSLFGYIFGSLIGVHLIFGIIEAFSDYFNASQMVNFKAASLSVMSHLIFGIITFYVAFYVNIYIAIIFTAFIHSYWNRIMLR